MLYIGDFRFILKPSASKTRRGMQNSRVDIIPVQNIHMPIHRFHTADSAPEIRAKIIDDGLLHTRLILKANIILLPPEYQQGNTAAFRDLISYNMASGWLGRQTE
jgi:hypothetical protein